MTWLKWSFDVIAHAAKSIAELDYLYIEWILNLVYPFLVFVLLLFLLPFTIVVLTFAASLYMFIKKHWRNLMRKNICESLFGLLLPSFYASLKLGGFDGFQDLIAHLNHSVTATATRTSSSPSNRTSNLSMSTTTNNPSTNSRLNSLLFESCNNQHNLLLTNSNDDEFLTTSSMYNSQQCSLIYNYTLDVANYFQLCYQIESNLVYLDWLLGLFKPLIYALCSLFLLPAIVVLLLYASSLFMFLTKHWTKLKNTYYTNDIWQASFKSLAIFWETQGAIWHGHEVIGLENIPDTGPALLIYYHAAMPIDMYYLHSKILLYKNRRMRVVADRFLFKVPGLASLLEAFEVTPGSLEGCVDLLSKGEMLAISPGGVREALFSDHNYEIIWGSRVGFAKVATIAKVPVIPMFTQNCREALRTLPFFKKFFRYIYEKTRLPLVPIYGMFPVKLRTIIGKPIEFDESRSAEDLKELTKQKIEELIKQHQRLPGSIFHALLDRFNNPFSKNNNNNNKNNNNGNTDKKSE